MDDADRAAAVLDRAMSGYQARRPAAPGATYRTQVCQACGEMTEPDRLRAVPCASRCLECQSDYERGSRR